MAENTHPDKQLQQFLRSTGWSCDDLLFRLNRLQRQYVKKNNSSQQVRRRNNCLEPATRKRQQAESFSTSSEMYEVISDEELSFSDDEAGEKCRQKSNGCNKTQETIQKKVFINSDQWKKKSTDNHCNQTLPTQKVPLEPVKKPNTPKSTVTGRRPGFKHPPCPLQISAPSSTNTGPNLQNKNTKQNFKIRLGIVFDSKTNENTIKPTNAIPKRPKRCFSSNKYNEDSDTIIISDDESTQSDKTQNKPERAHNIGTEEKEENGKQNTCSSQDVIIIESEETNMEIPKAANEETEPEKPPNVGAEEKEENQNKTENSCFSPDIIIIESDETDKEIPKSANEETGPEKPPNVGAEEKEENQTKKENTCFSPDIIIIESDETDKEIPKAANEETEPEKPSNVGAVEEEENQNKKENTCFSPDIIIIESDETDKEILKVVNPVKPENVDVEVKEENRNVKENTCSSTDVIIIESNETDKEILKAANEETEPVKPENVDVEVKEENRNVKENTCSSTDVIIIESEETDKEIPKAVNKEIPKSANEIQAEKTQNVDMEGRKGDLTERQEKQENYLFQNVIINESRTIKEPNNRNDLSGVVLIDHVCPNDTSKEKTGNDDIEEKEESVSFSQNAIVEGNEEIKEDFDMSKTTKEVKMVNDKRYLKDVNEEIQQDKTQSTDLEEIEENQEIVLLSQNTVIGIQKEPKHIANDLVAQPEKQNSSSQSAIIGERGTTKEPNFNLFSAIVNDKECPITASDEGRPEKTKNDDVEENQKRQEIIEDFYEDSNSSASTIELDHHNEECQKAASEELQLEKTRNDVDIDEERLKSAPFSRNEDVNDDSDSSALTIDLDNHDDECLKVASEEKEEKVEMGEEHPQEDVMSDIFDDENSQVNEYYNTDQEEIGSNPEENKEIIEEIPEGSIPHAVECERDKVSKCTIQQVPNQSSTSKAETPCPSSFKVPQKNLPVILRVDEITPQNENHEVEFTSPEDLRNRLKEQLNLLKTKTKVFEITSSTNISQELLQGKKRKKMSDLLLNKLNIVQQNKSQPEKKRKLDDLLVCSSEESGLKIVSVEGGYCSPPLVRSPPLFVFSGSERSKSSITVTKTKDITKIKGWRHKNLYIPNEENEGEECSRLNDAISDPFPGCSFSGDVYVAKPKAQKVVKRPLDLPQTQSDLPEKSAFVSDVLDQFLTSNCQLNISYEVPKLAAEETLPNKYPEIEFPRVEGGASAKKKVESGEEHKPRTLAEKRKMLQVSLNLMEEHQYSIKPDTETLENDLFYIKDEIFSRQNAFSKTFYNTAAKMTQEYSYVTYKGQKLRVVCHDDSRGELAKIEPPCKSRKRRHYSGVGGLGDEVTFKPGPLSKKPKLRHAEDDDSISEITVKKLPKIYLAVSPQVGKPVDPKIRHLIQPQDEVLTPQRVEFAVSTLTTKKNGVFTWAGCNKKYVFPVPYSCKEEYVLMHKSTEVHLENLPLLDDIDSSVKSVVDKMLDFVEIKEETENVVKEDEDLLDWLQNERNRVEETSRVPDSSKAVPRPEDKTFMNQMRMLGAKFIRLDVEEAEEKECSRLHCKLGCVCSSLDCNPSNMIKAHCGKSSCVLECTCNLEKPKSLAPVDSETLPENLLIRLNSDAKRHLAKEEKHFVPTVIQANDKNIVLDSVHKPKRSLRIPKKLAEYYWQDVFTYQFPLEREHELPSSITPERPKALWTPPLVIRKNESLKSMIRKGYYTGNIEELLASKKPKKVEETVRECSVRLDKLNLDNIIPYCLVHKLYKCHCNYTAEGVKFNAEKLSEEIPDYSRDYFLELLSRRAAKSRTKPAPKPKRSPLKSGPKKLVENFTQPLPPTKEPPPLVYDADVFERAVQLMGGLISPTKTLQKNFSKLLGNKRREFRLMPWFLLKNRFLNQTIFCWSSTNQAGSPKLILTREYQPPGPDYIDVRVYSKMKRLKIDIIRWLLTDDNPKTSSLKDTHAILSLENDHWEICGVCERKRNESYAKKLERLKESMANHPAPKQIRLKMPFLPEDSPITISPVVEGERPPSPVRDPPPATITIVPPLKKPREFETSFPPATITVSSRSYPCEEIDAPYSSSGPVPKVSVSREEIVVPYKKVDPARSLLVRSSSTSAPNISLQEVVVPYKRIDSKPVPKISVLQEEIFARYKTAEAPILLKPVPKFAVLQDIQLGPRKPYVKKVAHLKKPQFEIVPVSPSANGTLKAVSTIARVDSSLESSPDVSVTAEEPALQPPAQAEKPEEEARPTEKINSSAKVVFYVKKKFEMKKMGIKEKGVMGNTIYPETIGAELPSLRQSAKWRVISLQSNFSYLVLTRNEYSIKHSDLEMAVSLARRKAMTIIIRSPRAKGAYPHKAFGIYCTPQTKEFVFIGPYLLNEQHDVESLSYMNRMLVNTDLLMRLSKKTAQPTGFWYTDATVPEKPPDKIFITRTVPPLIAPAPVPVTPVTPAVAYMKGAVPPVPQSTKYLIIGGTLFDACNVVVKANDGASNSRQEDSLLKKPTETAVSAVSTPPTIDVELPVQTEPTPSASSAPDTTDEQETNETNKRNKISVQPSVYFFTNVQGMGYIPGYRAKGKPNSIVIDCPFKKEFMLFSTLLQAKDVLEKEIMKKVIPIPSTFRIKIFVSQFCPMEIPIMSAQIFNGDYAVGPFGVVNILETSEQFWQDTLLVKAECTRALNFKNDRELYHKTLSSLNRTSRQIKAKNTDEKATKQAIPERSSSRKPRKSIKLIINQRRSKRIKEYKWQNKVDELYDLTQS